MAIYVTWKIRFNNENLRNHFKDRLETIIVYEYREIAGEEIEYDIHEKDGVIIEHKKTKTSYTIDRLKDAGNINISLSNGKIITHHPVEKYLIKDFSLDDVEYIFKNSGNFMIGLLLSDGELKFYHPDYGYDVIHIDF